MSSARVHVQRTQAKKVIRLRSQVPECMIVEHHYQDETLNLIAKSNAASYAANKRAKVPQMFWDEFAKQKFLFDLKKKLQARKVIQIQ